MTTAADPRSGGGVPGAFKDWFVKRGFLFLLISTPMLSLFPGFFLRWTNFAAATAYTVVVAFAVLPVWVLYRRSRSDDPEEPVHHLVKYALWALVPYVVYNLARIPAHYALDIVFWDHWYDYGSELTGVPVDRWDSLIPGTLLHSLQGYVLVLGFYILYKRHTLVNALCYVWLFLSTIYTWTFPTYVLVDFRPPGKWFFVVWWAHLWMALAAWYLPKSLYSPRLWNRLRSRTAKTTVIILLVPIYFAPVIFVFWRAGTWQFPTQRAIDAATFARAELVQQGPPVFVRDDAIAGTSGLRQAHYEFTLRFGPRPYKDYINATKALDAGPITVTATLVDGGQAVAWCTAVIPELETPNKITNPKLYFPELQRMTYSDIRVGCVGPPASTPAGALRAHWVADVTLVGDIQTQRREFRSPP